MLRRRLAVSLLRCSANALARLNVNTKHYPSIFSKLPSRIKRRLHHGKYDKMKKGITYKRVNLRSK